MEVRNDRGKLRRDISRIYVECYETERRKKEEENDPKIQEIKKDSDERTLIQSDIRRLIKEGKGRIETLDYVLNKYKESRYCTIFSTWYEHHYAQIKKDAEKNRKSGETR